MSAGHTRARFSEIHCTENYSTGSAQNATDFIYAAGIVKPGRQKIRVYPTGVTYGEGSRFKSSKIYNKAEDLKRLVRAGKLPNNLYIQELIKYCEEKGIVREENHMIKETEILDIDKLTRTIRTTYYDYINGVNLKSRLSNGTFYRHRNVLLHYGIDIGETVNVVRLPVQTKVITLQPCTSKPDFYHMPEVKPWADHSHLSLVKTA